MHMDPHKLDSVHQWQPPCNPIEVHQFLGFIGYCHYFVPNYSKIAQPLLDLTKKTGTWHWGPSQALAFAELKHQICSSPILI